MKNGFYGNKLLMGIVLAFACGTVAAHGQETKGDSDAVKVQQLQLAQTAMEKSMERGSKLDDIGVPVATFLFVLALVLGSRYLRERTNKQRLELLKAMVDKGQQVPDTVVKQILGGDSGFNDKNNPTKQIRNGYGFTIIGIGLIAYGLLSHGTHSTGLILGIVFFGLGIGNVAAHRSQPSKAE